MKANELMIGDWVNFGSFIRQVIQSDYYQDVNGDCVLDEVKPIPLTAEILEKNGLKWLYSEPSGNFAYCSNEPPIHCTFIPNCGWFVSIGASGSTKVPFVEASMIQHVHELQNALKLCGIDKEIVL